MSRRIARRFQRQAIRRPCANSLRAGRGEKDHGWTFSASSERKRSHIRWHVAFVLAAALLKPLGAARVPPDLVPDFEFVALPDEHHVLHQARELAQRRGQQDATGGV